MPLKPDDDITSLLRAIENGDSSAFETLAPLIYGHLRSMAAGLFSQEREHFTLQPTALVHEAYIRLVQTKNPRWKDRRHFFSIAGRQMRQILVDHARKHKAVRRGGGEHRVELNEDLVYSPERSAQIEALDRALEKLETLSPRQAQIVELRYFAGLSVEETAKTLGCGKTTVKSDWVLAQAFLRKEMTSA